MTAELGTIERIVTRLGYKMEDLERPPLGVEVNTFNQHVEVPPARTPAGVTLEEGSHINVQRWKAPPNGIVVILTSCPIPKNRTAVESGWSQYRGLLEQSSGAMLFCQPGVGSDVRDGTSFGAGPIIVLPKANLHLWLWNTDPASVAKWTARWQAYALISRV